MPNETTTPALVTAAIASSRTGPVFRSFQSEAQWQGIFRGRFARLAKAITMNAEWHEQALDLLVELNAACGTRHPRAELPWIIEAFADADHAMLGAHDLLTCEDSAVPEISEQYLRILRLIAIRGGRRGFPLLSKWLHLLYPSRFAVYDKQTAASINAWASLMLPDLALSDPERRQYAVDSSYWVLHWDDPGWYSGILKFYRSCWNAAGNHGLQSDLVDVADRLQRGIRAASGVPEARVTVIDVIEGHLAKSNGGPGLTE